MAKGTKPRRKKKNRWIVIYKESPTEYDMSEITADELRVTDAGTLMFMRKGDPMPVFAAPPQAYKHVKRKDW